MLPTQYQEKTLNLDFEGIQTTIIEQAKEDVGTTKEKIRRQDQSQVNSGDRFLELSKVLDTSKSKVHAFISTRLMSKEITQMKTKNKTLKFMNLEKPYFENFKVKKTDLLPHGFVNLFELQKMFNEEKRLKKKIELRVSGWQAVGESAKLIKMSRSNKYIACAGLDHSISCFNFESKKALWHLENVHTDRITSIFISNEDRYLATGSYDRGIKIFDLKSGEKLHDFEIVHQNSVTSVALSSDNQYVISASKDRSIRVAKIGSEDKKDIVYAINFHANGPQVFAVSEDMKHIVVGSQAKSIQIFDFRLELDPINFSEVHSDVITSIVISRDDKYFVSASRDGSIKVFDLEAQEELYHVRDAHRQGINSIALTDDNKYIISGSSNGSIKVFDFQTRIEIYQFENAHSNDVSSVDVSSDNSYIVSACGDKHIGVFHLEKRSEVYHLKGKTKEAISSICVKGKEEVISVTENGIINIFNYETKETELFVNLNKSHKMIGGDYSITLSKDSQHLVLASKGDSIKIFDLKDPLIMREISDKLGKALAISNDSTFIITATMNHSILAFDINSAKEIFSFPQVHENDINALIISNDDKYIISGSQDRSIRVFKHRKVKKQVQLFIGAHSGAIKSLAISNNNKYIVSSSVNGSIKIFDIKSKIEVHHLKNIYEGQIASVMITKNDRFIISGSFDKSIKIINMDTKRQVHQYSKPCQDGHVTALAISHNDHYIIAGLSDGSIEVLSTPFCKNQHEYSFVSSSISSFAVFPNYEDVLLKCHNNSNFLANYEDFYIDPHYWTILHLYAIFRPSEILTMPSYVDFKVPFLVDKYHRTPLHYLLADTRIDYNVVNILFKYILDYVKDKRHRTFAEYHSIFDSLSNIWLFIVTKLSPRLVKIYLRLCLLRTPTRYNKMLPQFAGSDHKYFFNLSPILQPKILDQFYEKGDRQIEFKTLMINLDYNPSSDDMYAYVVHFAQVLDKEILDLPSVNIILDSLWNQLYPYMLVLGITYSAFIVAVSVHISLPIVVLPLTYPIYILAGIFLLWEIIKILFAPHKKYIKNPWTWISIAHILIIIVFVTLDVKDQNPTAVEDILGALIMIFGFLKSVSYLRLFSKTRNLLQIMMYSVREVLFFLFLLGFAIAGGVLFFMEINQNYDLVHKIIGYHVQQRLIDAIYNNLQESLKSGNILEIISEDKYHFWAHFTLVGGLFLSNIIIVSLIVSIMGDAQDQIQEKKFITDTVSRLWMVQEALILYRFFKRKKKSKKGYMIYCGPQRQEQDSKDSGWEGKMNNIVKDYKKSIAKQRADMHTFKQEISDVTQSVLKIQDEMQDVTEHLRIETKLEIDSVRQEIQEAREELRNEVDNNYDRLRNDCKRIIRDYKKETNKLKGDIEELKKIMASSFDQRIEAIKQAHLRKKKKSGPSKLAIIAENNILKNVELAQKFFK